MTSIDLGRWPELASLPPGVFVDILGRIAADDASSDDWSELYQQMAHQESPDSAAYCAIPFLLFHAGQPGFRRIDLALIAGVLATGRPPAANRASWVAARAPLIDLTENCLRTSPLELEEVGLLLASHGRLRGRIAAPQAVVQLALSPEDCELSCSSCETECIVRFDTLQGQRRRQADAMADLAAATGHPAWARAIEGMAGICCSDCGGSLFAEAPPQPEVVRFPDPWKRVEGPLHGHLNGPASEQDLQRWADAAGAELPPSLLVVYRAHDGESGNLGLIHGMRLLPVSEALDLASGSSTASWARWALPVGTDGARVVAVVTARSGIRRRGNLVLVEPDEDELESGLDVEIAKIDLRIASGELTIPGSAPPPSRPFAEDEALAMLGTCATDFLDEFIGWPGLGHLRRADAQSLHVEPGEGAKGWIGEVAGVVGITEAEMTRRAYDCAVAACEIVKAGGRCHLPGLGVLRQGPDGLVVDLDAGRI